MHSICSLILLGLVLIPLIRAEANDPPSVAMTSPSSPLKLQPPGIVSLSATASDADGFVQRVEFSLTDGTIIGTDYTAPYSVNWENISSGSYWLRSRAYDNKGAWRQSAVVNVIVNSPPSITLVAPAKKISKPALPSIPIVFGHLRTFLKLNGQTALNHADVRFTVRADDADGQIVKVEFYHGETLSFTDYESPFTRVFTDLPKGIHHLTAVAYDNLGGRSETTTEVDCYEAAVRINQIGYRPNDPKYFKTAAMFSTFEVRRTSDESVVFSGQTTDSVYSATSGENVSSGDFTPLNEPGTYYIVGNSGDRSVPFRVSGTVYRNVLLRASRAIYLNRCGCAIRDSYMARPACHLHIEPFILDGRDSAIKLIPSSKKVEGGWHNGSDFRRSVMTASQTVSRLLFPVGLFPEKLADLPFRLPEEERIPGAPELAAEAKWGADWILKMQNPDGSINMGIGPSTNIMPGIVMPQDDTLKHYLGMSHTWSTAKGGAALAKTSYILRRYDKQYAETCLAAARKAWLYLADKPAVGSPFTVYTYYNMTDWADRLWLAAELFRATGQETYHDSFKRLVAQNLGPDKFPEPRADEGSIRDTNLREALITYLFTNPSKTDPSLRAEIMTSLHASCRKAVARSRSQGHGLVLSDSYFREAQHPVALALQEAWWLLMAYELSGDLSYRNTALAQFHYALGRNPLSMTYVTRVGDVPPLYFHYIIGYATNKKPFGFLEKGATGTDVVRQIFRAKYPNLSVPFPEKCYFDYSHVDEPDMEAQAYLVAITAYFHATRSPNYAPKRN